MSKPKRAATGARINSREKAATTEVVADPHEHLRRVDEAMAQVIERAGPCPLPERAREPQGGARAFRSLVHAIVSQQLSGKAADTIFGRLEALGGGALPGPAELLALSDEALRGVGLSGAKTRGVKDLASRVLAGALDLDTLHTRDDEAVIELLTQVKGIGRWTAEMFLMFRLGRLDVLSTADLGLRKGLMVLRGLRELPDPETMERLTAHWRPYRSIGCWYLWRVAESAPPARRAAPAKAGAGKAVTPGAKKAAAKKVGRPGAKKAAAKKVGKAGTKKAVAKKAVAKKAVAKKAVTPGAKKAGAGKAITPGAKKAAAKKVGKPGAKKAVAGKAAAPGVSRSAELLSKR